MLVLPTFGPSNNLRTRVKNQRNQRHTKSQKNKEKKITTTKFQRKK